MDGPRAIRVLVATPIGEGGRGGIDRIMDEVRHELEFSPRPGLVAEFSPTRGSGHIAGSPFVLARFLARMIAARISGRIDVLHVNLSSHGSARRKLILCRAARLVGLPYVIHLHGSRFRQFWEGAGPGLSVALADMFSRAARILVLGRVWRDFVAARVPDAAIRIEIIPNATPAPSNKVPPVPAPSADRPVIILFLGRVGPRKGVPDLVDALARLPREPAWQAIIAGDGDVETTQSEVARRGIQDCVTLTGWVGRERVTELLRSADVLALPSFDENLPMSVIEAMSHGIAVVATPVGAVEDIVEHGITGFIVQPGDAAGLRSALSRLVEDPALRAEIGGAAREFHQTHLNIEPYVDRLARIWRAAADPQGSAR